MNLDAVKELLTTALTLLLLVQNNAFAFSADFRAHAEDVARTAITEASTLLYGVSSPIVKGSGTPIPDARGTSNGALPYVSPVSASQIDQIASSQPDTTLVYDDTVSGPLDCTPFEKYDVIKNACYYTCNTRQECAATENKINAALDKWSSDYQAYSAQQKDETPDKAVQYIAYYSVDTGEKIRITQGADMAQYRNAWNIFAAISPDAMTNALVSSFGIYSDANDEVIAFVEPDVGTKWKLVINMAQFSHDTSQDQVFTIIHEFSHILTLSGTQLNTRISESACTTYYTGEGCANPGSYIGNFVNRFWSKGMIAIAAQDGGGDQLYSHAPSQFVTQYAATNPGEDIAESFAEFVLQPESPDFTGIAAQKVNYFDQYTELGWLRNQMRTAIGLYATGGR